MQDFAELLKGIAAVLWPLVLVVAIIIFRTEFSCQQFVSSDPIRGLSSHCGARFCNRPEQG